MSTTVSLTKINLMSASDYEGIENPVNTQLYTVDIDTDVDLHRKMFSWGVPDLANEISLSGMSSYTTPGNGYVKLTCTTSANVVNVNGNTVLANPASYMNTAILYYPVNKGDVITATSLTNVSFIPSFGNTAQT